MKAILFTWLLLLPLQIFAQGSIDQLMQERLHLIQNLQSEKTQKATIFGVSLEGRPTSEYQLAMRILEKDNAIIQKLQLQDRIDQSAVISENENYKTITLSQEQDIQKLKNALAQKGYEVRASQLEKRKFELASLIFFVGTMIFGWLFVKERVAFEMPKIVNFIPILTEKK
ncbi:hypothetical protein [Algoriphagus machipongonensis]|uniref:Uncharacterized protein n=1 Tax=Algoriphagus machipongonensis TaxID=388413 RepID=A3HW73_9BACT|nr:hypothetical protein [Algoriphagus machipongonensis]EAZ82395.1 hypothetical protein ALPR1_04100 [Algoriphagus machipongonensis]